MQSSSFDSHRSANRVAIAPCSAQSDAHYIPDAFRGIAQYADLGSVAIFQHYLEATVVVYVRQRKSAAIFWKIQADHTRDLAEGAVAVIRVKNISFVTVPRGIRSHQLVDGVPSLFIGPGRNTFRRRICHHLAPKETREIRRSVLRVFRSRDIAIGDVQIGVPVMVEVPRIRAPGPSTHLNPGIRCDVAEPAVPQILV